MVLRQDLPLRLEQDRGVAQVRQEVRREAQSDAKLQPVVRFLDGITIKSAGLAITMTGKADTETIQALFMSFFGLRAGPPPG